MVQAWKDEICLDMKIMEVVTLINLKHQILKHDIVIHEIIHTTNPVVISHNHPSSQTHKHHPEFSNSRSGKNLLQHAFETCRRRLLRGLLLCSFIAGTWSLLPARVAFMSLPSGLSVLPWSSRLSVVARCLCAGRAIVFDFLGGPRSSLGPLRGSLPMPTSAMMLRIARRSVFTRLGNIVGPTGWFVVRSV